MNELRERLAQIERVEMHIAAIEGQFGIHPKPERVAELSREKREILDKLGGKQNETI